MEELINRLKNEKTSMEHLSVKQLRKKCKEKGVKNFKNMKKIELERKIQVPKNETEHERKEREEKEKEEKDKIEEKEKLKKRNYYNELCGLIRKGKITMEQKKNFKKIRNEIFPKRVYEKKVEKTIKIMTNDAFDKKLKEYEKEVIEIKKDVNTLKS